ncbi:MAG: low molecular weight phosphatase family protein [Candidatus Aminicenantaceae bacterium]
MNNSNEPISSILFVCYGNVCRSPMAEGLAKKMFGERVRVESAGLNLLFDGASDDAIKIMKELYSIDISDHKPRTIKDFYIDEFDLVIVLDSTVYHILKNIFEIPSEKLILWKIDDPFSQSIEAYRKVAEKLKENIKEFKRERFKKGVA